MLRMKLIACTLAAVLTAANVVPAFADTYDEIAWAKAEKDAAETSLYQTQDQIDALETEKNSLVAYLANLNGQMKNLSLELSSLSAQINSKKTQIEITKGAVNRAKTKEEKQYETMKARIRYLYEEVDQSLVVTLLASESVSEFLNTATEAAEMTSYDKGRLEEYQQTKDIIANRQAELEAEEKKLQELKKSSEDKKAEVVKLAAETNTKITEYEKNIGEKELAASDLNSRIQEQKEILAALEKQAAAEEAARIEEERREQELKELAARAAEEEAEREESSSSEEPYEDSSDEDSYDEEDSYEESYEESSYDAGDSDEESYSDSSDEESYSDSSEDQSDEDSSYEDSEVESEELSSSSEYDSDYDEGEEEYTETAGSEEDSYEEVYSDYEDSALSEESEEGYDSYDSSDEYQESSSSDEEESYEEYDSSESDSSQESSSYDSSESEEASDDSSDSGSGQYLGNFKLTAYCNCAQCCGSAGQPTASGTMPSEGRTVAMGGVDFGTKLMINGTVYTVEDRGTDYGHVDIFLDSHSACLDFGVQYADVYLVN